MNTQSKPLSSSSPSRKEFAGIFQLLGRISFWVQLFFGIASGIILFLVILSEKFSDTANPYIGLGIFLTVCSIVAVVFRIYWAYRYTRLAKLLQAPEPNLRPQKAEIIKVLRVGLIVSLVGLLFAFLAAEDTVVAVLAKALAKPQGIAYETDTAVRSLDLFLILADVNILGAHFLGSVNSLGLLNWLE